MSFEFDFSKVKVLSDEEYEERLKLENEEKKKNREIAFNSIMPKDFQTTDIKRLHATAVSEAKAWSMTPETSFLNLLIHGQTGVGKTRLAWLCLRKRYIENATTSKAIGAETFTRRMLNEKDLMQQMIKVPLLLLDDIGKERATATAEACLFELIRERMDNHMPTIYTTNYTNEEFTHRFNHKQTGTAITRRLKDSCKVVPMYSKEK